MINDLNRKIENLESKLIEQEHRPFSIFKNYFVHRKKWPKGDERRIASLKALLWSIFFSPGTIAITGGLIALLSLSTLIWQNIIIIKQNDLIKNQNKFFQQQILLSEISNEKEVVYGSIEDYPSGRKRSSLINLVNALRIVNNDSIISLTEIDMSEVDLSNLDLSRVDFSRSKFCGANLNGCDFRASILEEVDFRPSVFNESDVARDSKKDPYGISLKKTTTAIGTDFRGAKLNSIRANMVNFAYAKFSDKHLNSNSFAGSLFYECNILPFSKEETSGVFLFETIPIILTNQDDLSKLYGVIRNHAKQNIFNSYSAYLNEFKYIDLFIAATGFEVYLKNPEEANGSTVSSNKAD